MTLKETATANLALRRLRGESLSEIADEIVMIANAIRKLRATRLNEGTILLLIQDAIPTSRKNAKKMPMKDIKAVIDGIERLQEAHLKPKEKK